VKGDPKVIDALNEVLTGELTAINQYFLHARMCKNWGYERIAHFVYKESIEEMKHAQDLVDRILFLEGVPNLQKLGKLNIGETVPEQLDSDLKLEYQALDRLKAAIKVTFDAADHTSRELLEHILEDEEKHIDWIEMQLGQIKELGKQIWLAEQIKGESGS
jgi:bacterioferritin